MTVRCKFVCSYRDSEGVHFSPVYSGSEENEKFFKATPGGRIDLQIVAPDTLERFEVGKEYFIDLKPAQE